MTSDTDQFVCPIPGCNCDIQWRAAMAQAGVAAFERRPYEDGAA